MPEEDTVPFAETGWGMRAMTGVLIVWISVVVGLGAGCSSTSGPGDPSDNSLPVMVLVPAGSFVMGDGVAVCGVDERDVTLTRDFYLGQREVTNQEYMCALQWAYDNGYVTATLSSVQDNLDNSTEELLDLDSGDCEIEFDGVNTFSLRNAGHGINPDHPVKEVTWYGAARCCDWLSLMSGLPRAYEHGDEWSCNGGDPYGAEGYRLPTDAEWEYAARYNDDRIYPCGDESPSCDLANCYGCVGWTSPVGSYPDAPASLRLSDMVGNVSEWCDDWRLCDLGMGAVDDPVGATSAIHRVVRGGSWRGIVDDLRCAARFGLGPDYSLNSCGFRTARTANHRCRAGGPVADRVSRNRAQPPN